MPLGRQYPLGLLVVQNGEAPEPADTGDVNGYEFDGSTQFKYELPGDAASLAPLKRRPVPLVQLVDVNDGTRGSRLP